MTCSKVGRQPVPSDHYAFRREVPPPSAASGTSIGIRPVDQFGPWAPGLDRAERVGRLRTMRAITHLSLGPRGAPLADELQRAETNDTALEYSLAGLNALAPLDRRRVLASYAVLSKPA